MRIQTRPSITTTAMPRAEGPTDSEGLAVRRLTRLLAPVVVLMAFMVCSAAPAFAGTVWWGLNSGSWPSNLPPEGIGRIVVNIQNRGYASASGEADPVVVKDVLPPGLKATAVEGLAGNRKNLTGYRGPLVCTVLTHQEVQCKFEGASLPAGEELEAWIKVEVGATASSEEVNTVSVTGGGVPGEKTLTRHINVGEETKFGVENFELLAEEEGGGPVTQAGAHPFQITNVVDLNTSVMSPSIVNEQPAGLVKQYVYRLPPGLIGNPAPVPQCTAAQFAGEEETPAGSHNKCEPQTAVGLANVTHDVPGSGGNLNAKTVPVFNLTPEPGEPARFGFEVSGARIYIDTSVRTGGDYGVTLTVNNLIEITGILASRVTFWGVPGEAVHDSARGWACVLGEACPTSSVHEPPPLLSMPTTCTGPMETTLQATSWAEPHPAAPLAAPLFRKQEMGGLDGCNRLQFQPEISVAPDIPDGSTPTGLEVQVHVPQGSTLNPEGLAESTLKDTTVALPPESLSTPAAPTGCRRAPRARSAISARNPGNPRRTSSRPLSVPRSARTRRRSGPSKSKRRCCRTR